MPANNAINAPLPTQPNSANRYNQSLYNKRRLTNKLGLGFAMSAMVFVTVHTQSMGFCARI